jgi:YfiH family protein
LAEPVIEAVEVIRAGLLGSVPHGFLGRRGGVSTGATAGLNTGLGSGDDAGAVAANRARGAEAVLPGGRLVGVYQVHSPDCVTVDEPWTDDARPHADAMATSRPGLLLGIITADCAPVLLADASAGVIGAAHAGWRGAFDGVIGNTVEAMERLGARRGAITAAIGPCIGRDSYEVDEGFRQRFIDADAANTRFFTAGRQGHHQFALEEYVAGRLNEVGVADIERLGLDTYSDDERFFSFRRATHRGEPAYGRQMSLIALRQNL